MIPIRTETLVDTIDVGEWFSMDLEEEPSNPEELGATAVYLVRMGDVQFRIRAPYVDPGPIEVLEASRVQNEPRAKWPDLSKIRPSVVRMHRRRRGEAPESDASADAGSDEESE